MDLKKSKVNDIQRKSDFVYDVLQKTPSWIVTWGNTFFLLFLLFLLLLAHFIQYPDIIVAKTTIRMQNPPISVFSEQSDAIEAIYFQNGSEVQNGDIVVKIKSRASFEDILELENNLISVKEINDVSKHIDFEFKKDYQLGEISLVYNDFLKEYDDFKFFISNDNILMKMSSLKREISNIVLLNQSLKKQEELFEKKFELSKKSLSRNKILNSKGVISDQENENIEAEFLTESRQLESFRTNQLNNNLTIIQLRSKINELSNEMDEGFVNWQTQINEKVNQLMNEIEVWKKQFLLKAPISGKISLDEKIVVSHYVKQGEVIFDVIPAGKQNMIGLAEMPIANSGDIIPGTEAQIRLDAFPYQEYGILTCIVKEIALLPKESEIGTIYILELELPSNLKTSYGKDIPFSNGMKATALIIKKKKSLLQRVFDQLYSIFTD